MIKIEPLVALDVTQTRALLKHQPEPLPSDLEYRSDNWIFRGFAFWQHWLPCHLHIAPSVYVAKEDGVVLGLISLRSMGKSKEAWHIDHLVVHPLHRGRGVAQELLRFALALFGSQGVSHFVSEVAVENSAALSLFSSCGFRRCARVSHYKLQLNPRHSSELTSEPASELATISKFRLAISSDRHMLYQLHQDMLPADIRLIFSYTPEDFNVVDTKVSADIRKNKPWYWLSEDRERKVITSAVKVIAYSEHGTKNKPQNIHRYHLEFAIHPGWTEAGLANELIPFVLDKLKSETDKVQVSARTYDFQGDLGEILTNNQMEKIGDFCLLAREHWVRAKHPANRLKLDRTVSIPGMTNNPAINMPMATERKLWDA